MYLDLGIAIRCLFRRSMVVFYVYGSAACSDKFFLKFD